MSDCGGDDYGDNCDYGDSHHNTHTSQHHSSHSHTHNKHSSHTHTDRQHTLPSYEEAVSTSHHTSRKVTNQDRHSSPANDMVFGHRSRDQHNNDYHNTDPKNYQVYDNSIFEASSADIERHNQEKRSSAFAALKALQTARSEQRSTGMSGCTVCLIISFVIFVIGFLFVLTLLKWQQEKIQ